MDYDDSNFCVILILFQSISSFFRFSPAFFFLFCLFWVFLFQMDAWSFSFFFQVDSAIFSEKYPYYTILPLRMRILQMIKIMEEYLQNASQNRTKILKMIYIISLILLSAFQDCTSMEVLNQKQVLYLHWFDAKILGHLLFLKVILRILNYINFTFCSVAKTWKF